MTWARSHDAPPRPPRPHRRGLCRGGRMAHHRAGEAVQKHPPFSVMSKHCETCKFWDCPEVDGEDGWCQRFPPVLARTVPVGADPAETRFWHQPMTRRLTWCGEWQRAELAQADVDSANARREPPEAQHPAASSNKPIDFNSLPEASYVRLAQIVPAVVPVSGATLWRWIRENKFPAPTKLGPQVTAWRVGDVRDWLAAQKKSK